MNLQEIESIFNEGFKKVLNNQLPSLPLGDVTSVLFLRRIAESVSPPNLIPLDLLYELTVN